MTTETKTTDKTPAQRIAELQAEASGLSEAMNRALQEANADEYLRLMVRESAIPRELHAAQVAAMEQRLQEAEAQLAEMAAEEPKLRADRDKVQSRVNEIIRQAEAELEKYDTALYVNGSRSRHLYNDEIPQLRRELRALQERGPGL